MKSWKKELKDWNFNECSFRIFGLNISFNSSEGTFFVETDHDGAAFEKLDDIIMFLDRVYV